jgi:hypothetical protein
VVERITALVARLAGALRRNRRRVEACAAEPEPAMVVPLRPAPYTVRGEDVALVRPYYVAHEWRRPVLVRRALWMTSKALDLGPLAGHPASSGGRAA